MNDMSSPIGFADALGQLWPGMVIGTSVALLALWIGWSLARSPAFPAVRIVGWWIDTVVVRLVRSDRWWFRAVAIFLNNASVCAAVVVLGRWATAAWLAVAGVGLALGVALRVMGNRSWDFRRSGVVPQRLGVALGFALNMLEPPAIVLAFGLCLGRAAIPTGLTDAQVLRLFLTWVVPALSIAAMGEAWWLGAVGKGQVEG